MMRKTLLTCVPAVLCCLPLMAQTPAPPRDVNVVNTPTVQLAGTSTVQVSGTTNVRVQNDSASPVPVQDVSQPKRTPFQAAAQSSDPFPFAGGDPVTLAISVPAGKKLTIEQISARAEFGFSSPTPTPFALFTLTTTVAGVSVEHFLDVPQAFTFQCSGCDLSHSRDVVSQQVKLYADAGTTVLLTAQPGSGRGISVGFAISGYLEDAP